jgi:hypothetical protein
MARRSCSQRLSVLLQWRGGGAPSGRRSCYNGAAEVLTAAVGAATMARRSCSQRPPVLLQWPSGSVCYNRQRALLQRSGTTATKVGHGCYKARRLMLQAAGAMCYKRWRLLLPTAAALATNGGGCCYKSGAALLQGVRRGRRRSYHQRPPPVATNRAPPCCKESGEVVDGATTNDRRPLLQTGCRLGARSSTRPAAKLHVQDGGAAGVGGGATGAGSVLLAWAAVRRREASSGRDSFCFC